MNMEKAAFGTVFWFGAYGHAFPGDLEGLTGRPGALKRVHVDVYGFPEVSSWWNIFGRLLGYVLPILSM